MAEATAGVVALMSSLLLMWPVVHLLRARQVLDVPNARSSHSVPTVRGGGVAVMAAVVVGVAVSTPGRELTVLTSLALAASAVGLADDLNDLSAHTRLAAQLLLGLGVVAFLATPSMSVPGGVVAIVALVGVVGYVNAFNFMDGINGISGVTGALAGLWYLRVGVAASEDQLALGGVILLGACVGFLPWNFPSARVFLGDVGSYGLGLFIGGLAVLALGSGMSLLVAVAPLVLYAADTGWTLVQRVRRGRSWREAHREHVYQRLCDAGLSHAQVTATVGLVTLSMCAMVEWLPPVWEVALMTAVVAVYLGLPRLLSRSSAVTQT